MQPSTHPFHSYIAGQLDKLLREHHVVVFYDPRREFEPFLNELQPLEPPEGRGGLSRYWIQDLQTHLARHEGSFFALKAAVEPVVELDTPEPLIVYVPGVQRDRAASVLMELEKGGACYEPQLRRLARNVLRARATDGEIDDMLAPEGLTYEDVAAYLQQKGDTSTSVLKLVLGEAPSEMLIARWLVSAERDEELEAKKAGPELFKLVAARIGFDLDAGTQLAKARRQTLRFLLVNEFRSDLRCDAPKELAMIPEPGLKEQRDRANEITRLLRQTSPEPYVAAADGIETELQLRDLALEPAALGSIDTFRFEERVLLGHAATLVADGHYEHALAVVSERGTSFWVDRDLDAARWAQWELCRLAAELGLEVKRIKPLVAEAPKDPSRWVDAYAGSGRWYTVDRAQRAMESWAARMEEEAEEALEKALGVVRRAHESLLEAMAQGFSKSLETASWTAPGAMTQPRVFPDVVEAARGRTAYFLVDALRYEMGSELAELLADTEDLRLQPTLAVLPSITQLGMAALLPEASASYSVVEHKGKLAATVDGSTMSTSAERMKALTARRPGAVDLDLGELLQKSTKALANKLEGSELVVVRSQSIDGLGEMDSGHLARQLMDTLVGNVARAVRKLAKIGFERFVITADHGHQFSIRKGEDMLIDKPGGDTVDLHRRCWAGRGGATPPGCVRVSGSTLGYDTDLDFIFPRGLAVFRTGGDLAYHHGGISLQEMVVPVLSLRIPSAVPEEEGQTPVQLSGYPETITNRTFGLQVVIEKTLFSAAEVAVRLVLVSEGQEVGRAGMAVDAEIDRSSGTVKLPPGEPISVAMMLTRDEFTKVRIVAQDPTTDAIMGQSDELPVKLGM